MAGGSSTSTLIVKVIADAAQAQRELGDTANRIESFQKKIVGAAAGLFAADKIVDGIKATISAASDLEQSMGGIDAVFKQSAAQVHAWASDTADSVRIPQAAYEQLATVIGAQLKNAGVSMSDLAPKTRDLMQLGADLAAQFGTDIPQAIEAISSALKGERDPIERYGVTLKQITIDAKAHEIALRTGADAASQAVQAQAALALIYEQTADAQGAASRESQTYQARMDSLKEKLQNMAAAVGGPLLDGIGSLADRFADLAPSMEPIIVGAATFVSTIAQLPTPVLLAATALGGLVLVGPKIVGAFVNIGTAVATMGKQLAAAALTMLTTPWGIALTAVAALATGALILWTSAAAHQAEQAKISKEATSAFYEVLKRGGSGADLRSTAWDLMDAKYKELGTTVGEVSRRIKVDSKTMITGLASNGTEGAQVIAAFNREIRSLQEEMTSAAAVGSNGEAIFTVDNSDEIAALVAQRDAYEGMTPAIEAARADLDEYHKAVGDGIDTTEEAAAATTNLKDALKAAQDAAKRFAESGTEGAQLLNRFSQAASETSRAIQIYQGYVDEATGNNRAYQDSQAAFNATIIDIPEIFKKAGEGVGYSTEALKTWNTQNLTLTQGGQDVYKAISGMATAANDATVGAYENAKATHTQAEAIGIAKEQANNSYEQFVNMAGAMGLSTDEAEALAGKVGLLNDADVQNKIFQIIAEDQQAQQTAKLWEAVVLDDKTQRYVALTPSAQELADQMNGIIDGTKPNPIPVLPEIGDPTNPGGTPAGAAAAGETVPAVPPIEVPTTVTPPTTVPAGPIGASIGGAASTGGILNIPVEAPAIPDISAGLADIAATSVTVIITADTTQAWSAVQLFKAATVVPAVVKINADPAQANSVIKAVIGGQYSTTVHLNGDSVPVNNVIRAVIGGQYSTTVHIDGDNSGAISAIRNITTGYYTATIHVGADTRAFYDAWNSLPTTRSVTVTVNQVQGSVVPQAAPSGVAPQVAATQRGFALGANAPMSMGTSNSGGGSSINITVNGAVDPDSTARQIRSILDRRDRRTGGINI